MARAAWLPFGVCTGVAALVGLRPLVLEPTDSAALFRGEARATDVAPGIALEPPADDAVPASPDAQEPAAPLENDRASAPNHRETFRRPERQFAALVENVLGPIATVAAWDREPFGFVPHRARDSGFADLSARGGLALVLPLDGRDELHFTLPDGFAIWVRERDARGPGRIDRAAVVYEDGRGRALWTYDRTGYEEWLLVDPPAEGPVSAWTIVGGSPRQNGATVEIADERGRARLVVAAPAAFTRSGAPAATRLVAQSGGLELFVDTRERVLVDPIWKTAADMPFERFLHSTALLTNGKILVAGGESPQPEDSRACALYDVATGEWRTTGSLAFSHVGTLTVLRNGKVLLSGALDEKPFSGTCELYDPKTETWSLTGPQSTPRSFPTATLLPSGRVLMAGNGANQHLAEIYDPSTGTWSHAAPMNQGRSFHTATSTSGGVLVMGGLFQQTVWNAIAIDSVERYDEATDTWTTLAPLLHARRSHTARLLRNGKILVAAGEDGPGNAMFSAELYDPLSGPVATQSSITGGRLLSTLLPSGSVFGGIGLNERYDVASGTWANLGNGSPVVGYDESVALLPDARLIATGGQGTPNVSASSVIFDLATPSVAPAAPLARARQLHTTTLLATGKALLVGGLTAGSIPTDACELYDPSTATFGLTAPLHRRRSGHTASLLPVPGGQVLVAGGLFVQVGITLGKPTTNVPPELYDPASQTWTTVAPLLTPRYEHTATVLPDGSVLVVGGKNEQTPALADVELYTYDPAQPQGGHWVPKHHMLTPRAYHTATLLPNGTVLVAGGTADGVNGLHGCEVYDPQSDTWTLTDNSLTGARQRHTATLLPSGRVLVAGGFDGPNGLTTAEVFDPTSGVVGTWTATGHLNVARGAHAAALFPGGSVLFVGGQVAPGAAPNGTSELYDPAAGSFTSSVVSSARSRATATLLPNARILLAGGFDGTGASTAAVLYDRGLGAVGAATPTLQPFGPATAATNTTLSFVPIFDDVNELTGNSPTATPTNYPLLLLEREDNGALVFAPVTAWANHAGKAVLAPNLQPGWYFARAVVGGVPSPSEPILITK
jgi:N-acetylneuraminic acid mutarotase